MCNSVVPCTSPSRNQLLPAQEDHVGLPHWGGRNGLGRQYPPYYLLPDEPDVSIQAVLQHYIYKTNPCGKQASTCKETSPLNVWIQTGSYVLIAFSEILASITGLEYAFTKAPKNMRSLVMGVFLFTSAISSALGEAFVRKSSFTIVRRW